MLDADTTLYDITERRCELHTEQNLCDCAVRMHGSNIQQCVVSVHTRFRIYIPTFSNFFSAIYRFSVLESIARKIRQKTSSLTMCLFHHLRTSLCQEIIGFSIKIIHGFCEIPIVELVLRLPLITKYNLSCEGIRRIIDCHTRQVSQNLSGRPVRFQINKGCFRCNNIVITILSDLSPKFFGDRFIPRKS